MRWVEAVALGETGDKRAIPPLVNALRDEDRYVRYGSAASLKTLNGEPEDDPPKAYASIALQEWGTTKKNWGRQQLNLSLKCSKTKILQPG